MRQGRPWKWTFSPAILIQRVTISLSGKASSRAASVTAMSCGSPLSAAQRKGPLPRQNSGRM